MAQANFLFMMIMFAHWVADFILQTDEQAINKSHDNWALTQHVINYSIVVNSTIIILALFLSPWPSAGGMVTALLLTFGLHWATDWGTSRLNKWLYDEKGRHWFFVGVGFDQFLHLIALNFVWYGLIVHGS